MADHLITPTELHLYEQRQAVGDIPRLVEAIHDLLAVAPDDLQTDAEVDRLEAEVAELRTLAEGRAHLANDSAPDRLADAEAKLEALKPKPKAAKKKEKAAA